MTKQTTQLSKVQVLAPKCKDKKLVDQYVLKFFDKTKNAVENLIAMSEIVFELNSKVDDLELSINDLNYFCHNVGLSTGSSTFRKHVCIGRKADYLRRLIEDIPSAISTVYEITTIDPDEIEKFIEWKKLTPRTTLTELKRLALKTPVKQPSLSTTKNYIQIDFDSNQLSLEVKKKLLYVVTTLKNENQLKVQFPLFNEFENACSAIIDETAKVISYA
jgi:hypothetical protein